VPGGRFAPPQASKTLILEISWLFKLIYTEIQIFIATLYCHEGAVLRN